MHRITQRNRRMLWAVATSLALSVAPAAPALAAPSRAQAARATTTSKVSMRSRQVYTSTGITLRAGDTVSITATGKIRFGGGKITSVAPPGIPWGPKCRAIALSEPRKTPWPAKGLSCWSLIAKVDNAAPIEIGASKSFRAEGTGAGALLLGLNDNFVEDNSGTWLVTISVTPGPAGAGGSGAVPEPATKSSDTIVFVVIGVAVLALLLLLAWWRRRSAGRHRAAEAAVVAGAEPMLAALPDGSPAVVPTEFAPPETDSIDVNIFEVEFSNGLTLRIGYNHFPEGTELHWRVTQNRLPVAVGSFVTKGGGSTNHAETVPLGIKLEGRDTYPDGADVQFDWSINGVPFRYSVRRDPNC